MHSVHDVQENCTIGHIPVHNPIQAQGMKGRSYRSFPVHHPVTIVLIFELQVRKPHSSKRQVTQYEPDSKHAKKAPIPRGNVCKLLTFHSLEEPLVSSEAESFSMRSALALFNASKNVQILLDQCCATSSKYFPPRANSFAPTLPSDRRIIKDQFRFSVRRTAGKRYRPRKQRKESSTHDIDINSPVVMWTMSNRLNPITWSVTFTSREMM